MALPRSKGSDIVEDGRERERERERERDKCDFKQS